MLKKNETKPLKRPAIMLSLRKCKEQWASNYDKTWEDVQKDFEYGTGISKLYGFEQVMDMVAELYRKQSSITVMGNDEEIKAMKQELFDKYNINTDSDLIKQLGIKDEDKAMLFAWIKYQCAFSYREGFDNGQDEF